METKPPIELGREAIQIGDLQTAITHFTLAIGNAQNYVFTAALLERAGCYLEIAKKGPLEARADNLTKALKDFSGVLSQPSVAREERSRALLGKGHSLLVLGDTEAAAAAFQEVLQIEPQTTELPYHLEAHRELGRLTLGNDIDWILSSGRIATDPDLPVQLRKAQHHYSAGLEVDPEDGECNLLKGICLHARGLDLDAITYLAKACSIAEAGRVNNPRAHYYLARAVEKARGHQRSALEHYELAAQQDPGRTFKPLYARLVAVLLDYRDAMDEARFDELLQSLLSYSGTDRDYWSSVEGLASRLEAAAPPGKPSVCLLVRAIARARQADVEGAVKAAVALREEPDFLDKVAQIFPTASSRADDLHGRALTLSLARRMPELTAFLDNLELSPVDKVREEYQPVLILKGQNIVDTWRERSRNAPSLGAEGKTERDRALGEARTLFEQYLDLRADEIENNPDNSELRRQAMNVRLYLAEALELMESPSGAASNYIAVAKDDRKHEDAFLGILRLHSGKLLPEPEKIEAWNTLQTYDGPSRPINEYIQGTRKALQEQALLYCRGCGRQGSQGDRICLECGRQIGPRDSRPEPLQTP
jgi:tetratricopeptide (TPR) repeat protein